MLALRPPSSPPGKAAISAASSPASKLQKINIPLTVILNASSPIAARAIAYPSAGSVVGGQNADETRHSSKTADNSSDRRLQDFALPSKQKFHEVASGG